MAQRSTLLIGSMPFDDEATCMRTALDLLGPTLFSLPDGEVGEKSPQFPRGNRVAWVQYAFEILTADRENWQVVKEAQRDADGMPRDYDAIQKLKPRRSPAELPDHVRLGYDDYFRQSYARFKQLRSERGLDKLKFQLGIPTGSAMGFVFASKLDWLRYTSAFNTVLAREANRALEEAGDDVIVQLELPPELYAAQMLPKPLLGLALRSVHDLLGKLKPGAQIGIHLCLGDLRNAAVIHPRTLDKMVAFSNRLVATWPAAHRLAYVHYPFAEGSTPPTTDAGHYQPLRNIQLPAGTRFVAGFVHEKLSFEQNAQVLQAIEAARGQPVDLACSCGLGRRTPETARQLMQLSARLAAL